MGYEIKTAGGTIKRSLIEKTAGRRRVHQERTQIAAAAASPRNDLLPEQQIELVPIDALRPSDARVRKPSNAQVERIVRSVKQHGFIGAILHRGAMIIDGHSRVEAMKALGERAIPAIDVTHLDDAQCKALSIALNRIAEMGEWDLPVLQETMVELEKDAFDLGSLGFSDEEIDIILLPGDEDIEQLPDPDKIEPVTMLGDLWHLGDHRLLCGNALDPRSYARLLEGEVATACFTDMPFNIFVKNNVSGLGKIKHDEFAMASGEMTDREFDAFMQTSLTNIRDHVMEGGVIFSCIDWRHDAEMVFAGRSVGLHLLNKCIWDKGAGSMGGFYRSRHEIILVFGRDKTPAINNIAFGKHGRDRSNVWCYPGANRPGTAAAKALKGHPTPKNPTMVADAILDVTHRGDIVLDPFMGSGTTIIAAQTTGRRGFGIELDPKFVDLTVRRWEELTGHRAVRIPADERGPPGE